MKFFVGFGRLVMSRVGKMIIEIPEKVSVIINSDFIGITGPKGTIDISIHKDMKVIQGDDTLLV